MSWGTCYSGSNNIHFNYPPIMADGRNYASWQPEAVVNNRIRQQANIKSSWEYRQYLTNNAVEIMKFNNLEACNELGLDQSEQSNQVSSSNVPLLLKSTSDNTQPKYGYNNSDLKNPYLSREQLQSKMISPSIVPHQFN
jgi:hypothetical protein